jgi:hypothetical protein
MRSGERWGLHQQGYSEGSDFMFREIGLGIVTLSAIVAAAGGSQPQYTAIEMHRRLYGSSDTFPILLNNAGSVMVQEVNSFYTSGRIDFRLYDGSASSPRRLDEALGVPSIQMPAGSIGAARPYWLSDTGRLYVGVAGQSFRLYEPPTSSTPPAWADWSMHNGADVNESLQFARPETDAEPYNRLGFYQYPSPVQAPIQLAQWTIPSITASDMLFPPVISEDGRVAGSFSTTAIPRQRFFRWTPDLLNSAPGQFEELSLPADLTRVFESEMFIADAGLVAASMNCRRSNRIGVQQSFLWSGTQRIDLQQAMNVDNVDILDMTDTGELLCQTFDDSGANLEYVLFNLSTGKRVFDRSWINVPLSDDFRDFRPALINELGQIAGTAMYRDVVTGQFQQKAVLLTPVPEPGVVMVVAIAGATSLRRRRCRAV